MSAVVADVADAPTKSDSGANVFDRFGLAAQVALAGVFGGPAIGGIGFGVHEKSLDGVYFRFFGGL